jgi:VanZ family protein
MRSFLKYWLPLIIWLGVIFVGSTEVLSAEQTSRFLVPFLRWLKPDISLETLALIHFSVRKLGHFTEYAILAIFLWRAAFRGMNLKMKMSILYLLLWIGATIFAATDEFHQSFVPSRTPAYGDVMIDSCGAIFGLLLVSILARRRAKKVRPDKGKVLETKL